MYIISDIHLGPPIIVKVRHKLATFLNLALDAFVALLISNTLVGSTSGKLEHCVWQQKQVEFC